MRRPFVLPAAFFLSGAAGLIFQVVWLYRCGLALGSSLASITVVLSGFMAGLALGNLVAAKVGERVARPLGLYVRLEVVVAATGLLVTYALPRTAGLIGLLPGASEGGAALHAWRFLVAFVLLAVPTSLMGATLPILTEALTRDGRRFGRAFGELYGWNTLGAVAGVVFAETAAIATVGIAGSAWIAAGLNVVAALIASQGRLKPAPTTDGARPTSETVAGAGFSQPDSGTKALVESGFSRTNAAALLAASALAGASLLALEVIWFRFLSMFVLVTTLATSLMLAVVLAGIGLGGLLASSWSARRASTSAWLPVVALATGLAVLGPYALFGAITTGTQVGAWTTELWFAVALTLPASVMSGLLFTLTGDALHRTGRSAAAAAGALAVANTAGAIAGPPLAAWLLLPYAGMTAAIGVVAAAYGVMALLLHVAVGPGRGLSRGQAAPSRRVRGVVVAAAALGVALLSVPAGSWTDTYFLRAASAYAGDGATVVATKEGASETLFVMQQRWLDRPVYSRLVTNGFSMSGTALQGQRYMRAFAYYPMLLHDGPLKSALVVCYGVGVTVGAVTHIPSVEAIHVAEISRDIISMSDAIYEPAARPLGDPRVRLHVEDGRFFLQTTNERFDLITGEPPPPRTPGTVNIYTREYFQLVRDRLNEGGLATYWVPVARPSPGTDVNTIIRAFCDVFSDCSLWNATPFDLMLVGSRGAAGPRTMTQMSAPWRTPGLEARLREVAFERPEQIGATFLGDAEYLRALTRDTPPLVDDFPQRLRPVKGRPSLSDPEYGRDPAVTRLYQSALDVNRARDAFRGSAFIRGFWPPELIERSLPFFDQQAAINRVYWEGGLPLRQIADLDAVLSTTTLRTLPLWILGSDEVKQQIAESAASDVDGAVAYARGLRALSGRDYAGAAQWLATADQRGLRGTAVRPLFAYASLKAGRPDVALRLAANAQPSSDDERHFWEWIRSRGSQNSEFRSQNH
ncbi:MAG: hypothetical protein U0Q55_06670 [Vicinamibacterales bacterium]